MQYLINGNKPLTAQIILQILAQFHTFDLPKLQQLRNYYDGKQAILRKVATDEGKPCNKVVVNYCHNIVDTYLGYLTGVPIKYDNDNKYPEIMDILRYNDYVDEDNNLLRDALIFGHSIEINYIDEDGQQRFRTLDPRECIALYDNTLTNNLMYVIRYYKEVLWDNSTIDKDNYIVEVYGNDGTTIYRSTAGFSSLTLLEQKPNYYNQCPISVFSLNEDETSIFAQIITLQDAYNNLLSGEVDDFDAFADAYLVLKGAMADDEDLRKMKQNRVLMMDADCDASYLTKSISDTQIENMLTNINDKIYRISCCPDFQDEKFMAQSGVAMRYKLTGFEVQASNIASNMKKALQKRIELISSILALTDTEEIWRDVDIVFTRNLPVDLNESASVVNQLRGLVSDYTLYSLLPFVTNPQEELERVQKEQQDKMELYSFDTSPADNDNPITEDTEDEQE